MKLLKKMAFSFLVSIISSYAYADVIELDAVNPDHCRQQILQSKDFAPVIAAYTSNKYDGNSKEFIQKFERLAKAHPERAFFKWDANKDVGHITQTLCMQQLGVFVQPNIMLLAVVKNDKTGESFMSSPLRLEWAGEMSIPEMNRIIDVSDPSFKQSFLANKTVVN